MSCHFVCWCNNHIVLYKPKGIVHIFDVRCSDYIMYKSYCRWLFEQTQFAEIEFNSDQIGELIIAPGQFVPLPDCIFVLFVPLLFEYKNEQFTLDLFVFTSAHSVPAFLSLCSKNVLY